MWRDFSADERAKLMSDGQVLLPSDYGDPYPITRRLIEDGRENLVLRAPLPMPFPVRLLQGTDDAAVERAVALRLLDHIDGDDVRADLRQGRRPRLFQPGVPCPHRADPRRGARMSEPILFVPGMMSDGRVFGPQFEDLSRDFALHVARVTMAESIREMAAETLYHAPARFALAGHSMGGIVALEMLRRAPERVTRIALISTTPLPETPEQAAWREPQIVKALSGNLQDALRAALDPNNLGPGPGRGQGARNPRCDGARHRAESLRAPVAGAATPARRAEGLADDAGAGAGALWRA